MSPTALHPLSSVAYGKETTAGTLVVADTGLVVEEGVAAYAETEERSVRTAPRGVLAEVEQVLVRKASTLTYTQDLTFEEAVIPMLGGLHDVAATGVGPFTYTIDPSLTAPQDLGAFSFEVVATDGVTDHYTRAFAFGTCRQFGVSLSFGDVAQMSAEWFGRAGQTLASPATTAPLTRNIIPSELFALYIDPSFAAIGTTQVSTTIRSAELTVVTGAEPDYTLDGRPDLDLTQLRRGMITGTLNLTAELNADAAAELADWRAGDLRFIELSAAIGTNDIALQSAVRYIDSPTFSEEDGLVILNLSGRLMYDATSGKVFNAVINNDIASY